MHNVKNIRTWVNALRSDDYSQGTGELRDPDGNLCCLGVACEVAIASGVPVEYSPVGGRYDGESTDLPLRVQEWLGLSSATPHVVVNGHSESLISLNDEALWTFDQIADAIESTFLANEPS